MFRSPLTDYDTWACLTPGFLLLAAGDHVLRLGWIWRDTWTTVGAIFAIACAYVVGHACASLASLIIERGLVHPLRQCGDQPTPGTGVAPPAISRRCAQHVIIRRVPRLFDLHAVLGAMFCCFFQFQGSNS